ncbi:hypothetical protein Taro_016665 [Colocasia esculenta]|uniref:Smr domain-containing protein n=1 Tax=Colocasia esculenta TaxID=4460 RepID=A0A843UTP9_COLES|nr:hypothetical protein [Colocasia esculenta]
MGLPPMEPRTCFAPVGKPPGGPLSCPLPALGLHRRRETSFARAVRFASSSSRAGRHALSAAVHRADSRETTVPGDPAGRAGAVATADGSEQSGEVGGVADELRREAEEALEWRTVCSRVAAFASTSMGREACEGGGMPVGRDREESQELLDQTAAAVLLPRPLDFSGVEDVSRIVSSAVAGEVLSIRELCTVEKSLRAARGVYEQLVDISSAGGSSHRYSPLLVLLHNCNFLTGLVQKIESCIDCILSLIRDQASNKLQSIRSERRKNMENLDFLLKGVSTGVFQSGGIDSPLVTKRRSRMCVGIKASHKSLLPDGIVLGISSSGATYFMEPIEAVELNNMEVRLSNAEKSEELAILSLLTSDIVNSERDIRHLMERILQMDLASARGAYALLTDSIRPVFCENNKVIDSNEESFLVDIEGFCHPLLLESSHGKFSSPVMYGSERSNVGAVNIQSGVLPEGATVVPVDIKVGHATKVVVISGPNTGGKTATMKSLGLASLMTKAGMFLPAKRTPTIPWFDQVLADIGDHQSLEHNLSTFSGHISRLCKILEVASPRSLVLIDEVGSGTDPSEGVALATSILQHLAGHVNLAVVTTHYADLSLLKADDPRFENAAMEFCVKTLLPTYRILWGSTGNSNALSIAKSIGFDQKVLDRAQEWVAKLVPDKQKERQGLLYQSLLRERNILDAEAKKAESVLMEVKKVYHEIHSEAKDLDKREAALKAKEAQEVHQEVKLVKSQIDVIIKNFEEQLQSASPDQFNILMRQSEAAIASIVEAYRLTQASRQEDSAHQSSYTPQVGDQVHVRKLGNKVATVMEAPGDDGSVLVQSGNISVRVKRNDIKLIRSGEAVNSTSSFPGLRGKDQRSPGVGSPQEARKGEEIAYSAVVQTSKNTVDLRGMRVEEASYRLHMAISGCRSYGVLFIVHGVGTGAVKECALRILKDHPRVSKFEEESPMNDGCTVAYIK